jgi:hypothetical protein
MKTKYLIFSSLIIFIFALLWNGLIHLVILKSANDAIQYIHRSDFQDKICISLIVTLCIAILFTISYIKWRKDGSLKESILHSIFFSALIGIVVDLNQYVLYPLPYNLVVLWFLFGIIEFLVYGLIVRVIFKFTVKVKVKNKESFDMKSRYILEYIIFVLIIPFESNIFSQITTIKEKNQEIYNQLAFIAGE